MDKLDQVAPSDLQLYIRQIQGQRSCCLASVSVLTCKHQSNSMQSIPSQKTTRTLGVKSIAKIKPLLLLSIFPLIIGGKYSKHVVVACVDPSSFCPPVIRQTQITESIHTCTITLCCYCCYYYCYYYYNYYYPVLLVL